MLHLLPGISCLFLPFRSIHLHFFQNLSRFFPVLAVANNVSCVGPQNKIGHPSGCRFPCLVPAEYLHHQSINHEGRWGTTGDFATSFLHFSLFSTALWDLPNPKPVHSLMLSSPLFLCLPCLLPPFTVPCKMVLARPDERETWPYHCSLHLFTIVGSSCGPIACWILAWTSSLVTWSLYEMCSTTHMQNINKLKKHDLWYNDLWN